MEVCSGISCASALKLPPPDIGTLEYTSVPMDVAGYGPGLDDGTCGRVFWLGELQDGYVLKSGQHLPVTISESILDAVGPYAATKQLQRSLFGRLTWTLLVVLDFREASVR